MSQKKSNTRTPKCKTYTEQATAIDRRIDRAEASGTLDLILAGKRIEIEARAVYDAITVAAPDFIRHAILAALKAAAQAHGLPPVLFCDDERERTEEAVKMIAEIFTLARNYKLADQDSVAALADHLAAVINHPLPPASLYNTLADELADLANHVDHHSPEYLEKALIAFTAKQQEVRANG